MYFFSGSIFDSLPLHCLTCTSLQRNSPSFVLLSINLWLMTSCFCNLGSSFYVNHKEHISCYSWLRLVSLNTYFRISSNIFCNFKFILRLSLCVVIEWYYSVIPDLSGDPLALYIVYLLCIMIVVYSHTCVFYLLVPLDLNHLYTLVTERTALFILISMTAVARRTFIMIWTALHFHCHCMTW